MKSKYLFLLLLTLLILGILYLVFSFLKPQYNSSIFQTDTIPSISLSPSPQIYKEPLSPTPTLANTNKPNFCTSDAECPHESSCWYRIGGPAGIKGSPEHPGKCIKNEDLKLIF